MTQEELAGSDICSYQLQHQRNDQLQAPYLEKEYKLPHLDLDPEMLVVLAVLNLRGLVRLF